jgi:Zn-dependent M16 (insulinase) family peptidase
MNLLNKIFGEKPSATVTNKPWKYFEKKAKEAEEKGLMRQAAEYYEQALQKLKERFEPSRMEDKYYRYKRSAITFSLHRVRHSNN